MRSSQNFAAAVSPSSVARLYRLFATLADAPCLAVYPAVVALARNLGGTIDFARLVVDVSAAAGPAERAEAVDVVRDLAIVDVPSFLFYRDGREVHRWAGSSRGDLLGQVLTLCPDAPLPENAGRRGPLAERKRRSFRKRGPDDPPAAAA